MEESKEAVFLRWAEECLRDVSERVEHAGTADKMIKDITARLAQYWRSKHQRNFAKAEPAK